MSKRVHHIILLVVMLLASGCSSSRHLTDGPSSLHEVNQVLQDHSARIILQNGRVIEKAREVRIDANQVTYRHSTPLSFPIAEVQRIEVEVNRVREASTVIGMVPGIAYFSIGAFYSLRPREGSWDQLAGPLAMLAGIGITAVGALLGTVVGEAAGKKKVYVVWPLAPSNKRILFDK